MKIFILFSTLIYSFSSFSMFRALNTAATGMSAQEQNVSSISNNIANLNTIGFKKGRTEFEDLLYETITEAGSKSSATTEYNVGLQIGTGAKVTAVRKEFSLGDPQLTNNPFDFMIRGQGFFGVIMPSGEVQYTRDGSFNVEKTGTLVDKNGYKVFPGLVFPPNTKSVHVSTDGKVDAYIEGQVEPINIGQMPVFTFINPVGLKSMGRNLFRTTTSSGAAIQNIAGQENSGPIEQGTLESSNVKIMNEMTSLIKAQRAYEMNSKVMGIADQMLQTINNIR